jgi:HlyD family secretion protein
MLIPKQALLTQDNASYVFIVEDGVAHKKQVATGFVNSHQIEITDGLSTNDLVITMGQRNLRDQTQVEVIEAVADL